MRHIWDTSTFVFRGITTVPDMAALPFFGSTPSPRSQRLATLLSPVEIATATMSVSGFVGSEGLFEVRGEPGCRFH
jgi:hypothetical protein